MHEIYQFKNRNKAEINFAKYGEDTEFEVLNKITVPIFMRWGNQNEMMIQKAEELVLLMNDSILNLNKDIDFIDGADHGYTGKEEILAQQIIKFILR